MPVAVSACLSTAVSPARVAAVLDPVRGLVDEVVLAADARLPATVLDDYATLADRVLRVESVEPARHLAWLHAQCRGRWTLLLDPEELVSAELAARLPELIAHDDVRQVWARRWWLHPDGARRLAGPPWDADRAPLLLRAAPGQRFVGLPGALVVAERPFELVEEPVYRLELPTATLAQRRARVIAAEVAHPGQTASGGGRLHETLLLPELRRSLPTAPIAPADLPAIARALATASTVPAGEAPGRPRVVGLAETDMRWSRRRIPASAHAARIEPLTRPVALTPGQIATVTVAVTNTGSSTWSWDAELGPSVRVSYHVLRDGAVVIAEGRRTPLPRTVSPGDHVDVDVEVEVDRTVTPGSYTVAFDLVHEHVCWFGCVAHAELRVSVPTPAPSAPRLVVTAPPPADAPTSIPRLLHRVWTGGSPLPPEAAAFGERLAELHPEWTSRLWTDADLETLAVTARERRLCRSASELSNLVRYAVLARYGGVYLDTDVEPLRAFDALLPGRRAFAGLELPQRLGTAVLGAEPGHPLLVRAAAEARGTVATGAHNADANGPLFFTLVAEQEPDGLAVLPQGNFYPYSWTEPERRRERFPDAYCAHHWTMTWVGAET